MLAASNDTVVSTPAIEEFAYHLRAGSHLVIAGSKHEILQEQDRYRAQFWAAFDAFVPGTPLFKMRRYGPCCRRATMRAGKRRSTNSVLTSATLR